MVRICVREVSLTLVSVCGSTSENGGVVDGNCATAAY